jgi:hypothetical protein
MEQSPPWETNSHSAGLEIPCFLWNPTFRYRDYKNPLIPRPCVTFRNKQFLLRRGIVDPSSAGGLPLVGCPRLLIQCIRTYLPSICCHVLKFWNVYNLLYCSSFPILCMRKLVEDPLVNDIRTSPRDLGPVCRSLPSYSNSYLLTFNVHPSTPFDIILPLHLKQRR